MAYSYGTQGAPAVGGGAPGLPSRGNIGDITLFNSYPGTDYLLCDGSHYPTNRYLELSSVLSSATALPGKIEATGSALGVSAHITFGRTSNFSDRIIVVYNSGTVNYARWSDNYGVSWTQNGINAAATSLQDAISSSSGTWVAVGPAGVVYRSTDDGANWASATSLAGANAMLSVETDNKGTWIVCGNNGVALRSVNDTSTWATISVGLSTNQLSSVATDGNGVWVIVASGVNTGAISYDNGATWSGITLPTASPGTIFYSNGHFTLCTSTTNTLGYASFDSCATWMSTSLRVPYTPSTDNTTLRRFGRDIVAPRVRSSQIPVMSINGGVTSIPVDGYLAAVCGRTSDDAIYVITETTATPALQLLKITPAVNSFAGYFAVPLLSVNKGNGYGYYIKAR